MYDRERLLKIIDEAIESTSSRHERCGYDPSGGEFANFLKAIEVREMLNNAITTSGIIDRLKSEMRGIVEDC